MDQVHFTAARTAGSDRSRMSEAAFYNAHSFERWHRCAAVVRRILAWRPSSLRRVQRGQTKLRFAHAR